MCSRLLACEGTLFGGGCKRHEKETDHLGGPPIPSKPMSFSRVCFGLESGLSGPMRRLFGSCATQGRGLANGPASPRKGASAASVAWTAACVLLREGAERAPSCIALSSLWFKSKGAKQAAGGLQGVRCRSGSMRLHARRKEERQNVNCLTA